MDNADVSKFIYSLQDIRKQKDFISYFQNKITNKYGYECHLFDGILLFFTKIKEIINQIEHVYQREANRKIRRYWLERQMDDEWLQGKRGCFLSLM